MPRILLAVIGCGLLAGVGARAQLADLDQVCVVFDFPDGCRQNCFDAPLGETYSAHVVLQNPSEPSGVSGYEFCLCNTGGESLQPPAGTYLVGWFYPPGAIIDPGPCWVLGFNTPEPWAPCVWLLTIQLLTFTHEAWCFGVEPTENPTLPGHVAYAAGDDPANVLPMWPCTGPQGGSCDLACIDDPECPPPITGAGMTWGATKVLYR
jgi:hypothetical protein